MRYEIVVLDDVHVLANQVAGREHFDSWSDSPERVDVLLCQEVTLRPYHGGGARVRVNVHRVQLGVLQFLDAGDVMLVVLRVCRATAQYVQCCLATALHLGLHCRLHLRDAFVKGRLDVFLLG